MKTVLTIAGFDPSSGAGVTADLMVFAAHGLFGTACITGLTVQSTVGVRSVHPTPASIVESTLECLQADLPPAGIKIGMISTADNIRVINRYIQALNSADSDHLGPLTPIVLDPVLRSSSGRELLEPAGIAALRKELLPLVGWITPNLDELALLAQALVVTREDVPAACRVLQDSVARRPERLPLGIFATGGHLDPPDDFLLLPSGEGHCLPGQCVATSSTHGTGCALSSAFLSRLVLGDSPLRAAQAAKDYVAGALESAVQLGAGNGPLNLLWAGSRPPQ
jgi:hydroxymethylpyrimidine/phosphomethylpyrimidine kinase